MIKSFVSHESVHMGDSGYELVLVRKYKHEPWIEMAIFTDQCIQCRGFWEKMRWVVRILSGKEIWGDQVMLNHEDARKLGETLINLTSETADVGEIAGRG
jgi:hypothetical protein